jgi:hypothetical protein
VRINGPSDPDNRLPNTLSIGLRGVQASTLLANLADQLAASAGAACHTSSHASVSAVLRAMEVTPFLNPNADHVQSESHPSLTPIPHIYPSHRIPHTASIFHSQSRIASPILHVVSAS